MCLNQNCFLFVLFLFFCDNFLSVLKKTLFCFFCSYLKTPFILKKPVVVYLLRLLTNRSKQFCGLTLFRGKKELPSLFFRRCLALLLGREGSVFLDAWCGRTTMRIGWLGISGGRYERGGYGNVWKKWLCICDNFLGEFPLHLYPFCLFLPQNLLCFVHVSLTRHWDTSHKLVCRCVRGVCIDGKC